MEYTKLGKTGLTVSRICLGCMSYGDKQWRDWVISAEDEAREHFATALEAGINFFDTADVYSVGVSEEITGRWLGEMATRDEIVVATKVTARWVRDPTAAGSAASTSSRPATPRCAGSRSTSSTSTRSIDGTSRTPIEETLEALDSLVRAGKVRYLGASSMAAWQFGKALYTAERTRMASLRLDAEPLQPGLSRGRARDDSAVHRPGRRRDSVEPARARLPGRQSPQRAAPADTRAPRPTTFARDMYFREYDFAVPTPSAADRARARRHAGADRMRMDSAGARRHRADHRRDQARPSQGADRVGRHQADARKRSRRSRSPTSRIRFSASSRPGPPKCCIRFPRQARHFRKNSRVGSDRASPCLKTTAPGHKTGRRSHLYMRRPTTLRLSP